jgi:hypothetical protein
MIREPLLLLTTGEAGRRALELAVAVAGSHRSRLTVALLPATWVPWWCGVYGGFELAVARREACASGERLLAAARDALPADLSVRTCVLDGTDRPDERVLRALERGGHDLLVMQGAEPGTCAVPGLRRLARRSPVPVLRPSCAGGPRRHPAVPPPAGIPVGAALPPAAVA